VTPIRSPICIAVICGCAATSANTLPGVPSIPNSIPKSFPNLFRTSGKSVSALGGTDGTLISPFLASPALREAITNAVLHKDYSDPNPVQINVFSDEITIYTAGLLPVGWTADDLTNKHRSWLRNPDLARVFFRSGQIEAWGRGIQRIQEACADEDSPGPAFRTIGDTLETTFAYNPVWFNADPRGTRP